MSFSLLPRIRNALLGPGTIQQTVFVGTRSFSNTSTNGIEDRSSAASAVDSSSGAESSSTDTTHYRITLRRSAIGLPAHKKRVIESLGLRKRLGSVYRVKRADIAGMVLEIKELVHVENVRRLDGGLEHAAKVMAEEVQRAQGDPAQLEAITPLVVRDAEAIWVNEKGEVVDWGGRKGRKAPRGFTVVGNIANESRHRQILASKASS